MLPVLSPEVAAQKAYLVASRIVRMRQARERVPDDAAAQATIRANLATAVASLRVFNRLKRARAP